MLRNATTGGRSLAARSSIPFDAEIELVGVPDLPPDAQLSVHLGDYKLRLRRWTPESGYTHSMETSVAMAQRLARDFSTKNVTLVEAGYELQVWKTGEISLLSNQALYTYPDLVDVAVQVARESRHDTSFLYDDKWFTATANGDIKAFGS
jgi:hypothetical protein